MRSDIVDIGVNENLKSPIQYKSYQAICDDNSYIKNCIEINDERLSQGFKDNYNQFIGNISRIRNTIKVGNQADEIALIFENCLSQYQEIIILENHLYRVYILEILDLVLLYQVSSPLPNCQEYHKNTDILIQKLLNEMIKRSSFNKQQDFLILIQFILELNQQQLQTNCESQENLNIIQEFTSIVIKQGAYIGSPFINTGQFRDTYNQAKEQIQKLKNLAYSIQEKDEFILKPIDIGRSGEFFDKNNIKLQICILQAQRIEQFSLKEEITLEDDLLFFIDRFIEFTGKKITGYLILYIMIQIIYLLEKGGFIGQDNNQIAKQLSSKLSTKNEQVNDFILLLQQKQIQIVNIERMFPFYQFSFKDITFRFVSNLILLKYYEIIQFTNLQYHQKQQYLLNLFYSYVTDKNEQVKLLFQNEKKFIDIITQEMHQNRQETAIKLIQKQKERVQDLIKYQIKGEVQIYQYEFQIKNEQEVFDRISINIADYLELQLIKRFKWNELQNNQFIEEKFEQYVNQKLSYIKGNQIFHSLLNNSQIYNSAEYKQKLNAIEDIIQNFLQPNFIQVYDNSIEKDKGHTKDSRQQCRILGILADGGMGKSMLLKKLVALIIKDRIDGQIDYEDINYIPIFIQCNTLNPINPSIEDHLKEQNLSDSQIFLIKNSPRNKLLLLDGYDQYQGDCFRVYSQLKLKEWKNTQLIVTSRTEKLSYDDISAYFSADFENGKRNEYSYTTVKLNQLEEQDIENYFELYSYKVQNSQNNIDQQAYDNNFIKQYLKNQQLQSLLQTPMNLFFFTRLATLIDKQQLAEQIHNLKDEVDILEMFFKEQFKNQAILFIQNASLKEISIDLQNVIIQSFFEYYQFIAMKMLLNKGENSKFLQIDTQDINFSLNYIIQQFLNQKQQKDLLIIMENFKIITQQLDNNYCNSRDRKTLEFKHKSIFEYFSARSMKYDFDVHKDKIDELTDTQLSEFSINKKIIMNLQQNQSEQQILIKLYKLMKYEIHSDKFIQTYNNQGKDKSNKFLQYIRRSKISKNTDQSIIDTGASNLISALFLSRFSFPNLDLSQCSLSQAYLTQQKDIFINLQQSNLRSAFLKNSNINLESCNCKDAYFQQSQKIFDSNNIYQTNGMEWDEKNVLYCVNQNGIINIFDTSIDNYKIIKSKQISCSPLTQILIENNNIFVSSKYSIYLINKIDLEIFQMHTFINQIHFFSLSKNNILLITLKNGDIYKGDNTFKFNRTELKGRYSLVSPNGKFIIILLKDSLQLYSVEQNLKLINQLNLLKQKKCLFTDDSKYLITFSSTTYKVFNVEKDLELIKQIEDHIKPINCISISKNQYLATGYEDKSITIWNIVDQKYEIYRTLQGHTQSITSLAFSPDESYLATYSEDQVIKKWNLNIRFEQPKQIEGHSSQISQISYSVDGKYLVTSSFDKTCKIWDVLNNYTLLNTLHGHKSEVNSISFSNDGEFLATGSDDNTCKIWKIGSNFELVYTLEGHKEWIKSVSFSKNCKYLATGSGDQTCKIWKVEDDFSLVITIETHNNTVMQVDFSNDNKNFAICSADNTFSFYNVEWNFEHIKTISGESDWLYSISFSNDDKYLATGGGDKTCKIWNVKNDFELIHTLSGHTDRIYSVSFSKNGKYLATSSQDNTCKLWNIQKNFDLIKTIKGHNQFVSSVAFSQDSKFIATSSKDKSFKIWSVDGGFEKIKKLEGHKKSVHQISFSKDGKYFATVSGDKNFKIWDTKNSFELIVVIEGHTTDITCVAFSYDGKYLVTGSKDNTCKIWDIECRFKLIKTLYSHDGAITSINFSKNCKYLATSSHDKTCRVWDIQKNFELIYTLEGHTEIVKQASFSQGTQYLATCSSDCTCNIWDISSQFELIHKLEGHTSDITSVAFSKDDIYLITGSSDQTFKVWNSKNNFEIIDTIKAHKQCINYLTFSKDGKYLVTGSKDKTCKIWKVENGFKLIQTIEGHTQEVTSIAFSCNDKYLATSSRDRTSMVLISAQELEKIKSKDNYEIKQDNLPIDQQQLYINLYTL